MGGLAGHIVSSIARDRKHTNLNGFMPPIEDAFTVEGGLLEGTRNYVTVQRPLVRPIAQDVAGEGRGPTENYQYQEHEIHAAPPVAVGGINPQFGFSNTTSNVPQRVEGDDSTVAQVFFWGNHQTLQGVGVGEPVTVVPVPSTSQTQRKYLA